jgi:Cft2 family RNA processing exonuclease
VLQFCKASLDAGTTPVLIAYSLGKGQEILASLLTAKLPIQLHASSATMTEIYADLGYQFPRWTPLDPQTARGHIIITPTARPLLSAQPSIGPLRIASLSGWALDRRRPTTDENQQRFALSDHADFQDLVRFVQQVRPQRVFTLHGFAADFARYLRRQGMEAYALSEDDQLELSL